MVPEYMTVQGKQIPYTRQPVAVADLELDPANPRIQYLIGQKAAVGENELDAMILGKKTRSKHSLNRFCKTAGYMKPCTAARE